MEATKHIPTYSDGKWKVWTEIDGFDMAEHDFKIDILNYIGQKIYEVHKDEMFTDSDGNYYFTLERLTAGQKHARFYAAIPDDDYDKQERIITDKQLLCVVGDCGCSGYTMPYNGCNLSHKVHYEQVWTVNLDDGTYLCDKDGELILTSDGKRIKVA